jgi:hypothetical protein
MASSVDICNEALSHLGDSATVSSIDPPEGSAQAEHCARFYPSCLATLLEMHPWAFATRRAPLAQVANPSTTWAYAYSQPSGCINILAVLAADAADDYSAPGSSAVQSYDSPYRLNANNGGAYTPQDFSPETNDAGDDIILSNQANAVLRFTVLMTDTAKFTPMFRETLAWMLASKLAGPVLKGDTGRKAALQCMQTAVSWFGKATDSDASSRKVTPRHQVGWINAR